MLSRQGARDDEKLASIRDIHAASTDAPIRGEAHLQPFQGRALFTQVTFFQDTAGSTTRLSHSLNVPGASLTDSMFLMIVAE